MAVSFSNYQVRSRSAADVIAAMQELVRDYVYVSPVKDGWVTVYGQEPEAGDAAALHKILRELSLQLSSDVWFFGVYDSDVFYYLLFDRGEFKDEYHSNTDLLLEQSLSPSKQEPHHRRELPLVDSVSLLPDDGADEEREEPVDDWYDDLQGNVDDVLRYCLPGTTRDDVDAVLGEEYVLEEERCAALAALLGIDQRRAACGLELFESLRAALVGRGEFQRVEGGRPLSNASTKRTETK